MFKCGFFLFKIDIIETVCWWCRCAQEQGWMFFSMLMIRIRKGMQLSDGRWLIISWWVLKCLLAPHRACGTEEKVKLIWHIDFGRLVVLCGLRQCCMGFALFRKRQTSVTLDAFRLQETCMRHNHKKSINVVVIRTATDKYFLDQLIFQWLCN